MDSSFTAASGPTSRKDSRTRSPANTNFSTMEPAKLNPEG